MTYNLGQAVQLSTVARNAAGNAADATIAITVTKPDGTTGSPSTPSHDGTGLYSSTVTVDQTGVWQYRWDATGAILTNDRGQFSVADPKPPAYATLADLKSSLTLTASDRDDRLLRVLGSASRAIDRATGRRFWLDEAATARTFNPRYRVVATDDGEKLLIDDIGTTTGLIVEVGAGTSWSAISDYETAPDNALVQGDPVTGLLRPRFYWQFTPFQRVRVTAHWGYPAIPDEIVEATLLLANRLYKRKDSPEGVLGSAEWGPVRVSRTDPDVLAMIESYVLPGIG